jgi:hypothetical protein
MIKDYQMLSGIQKGKAIVSMIVKQHERTTKIVKK